MFYSASKMEIQLTFIITLLFVAENQCTYNESVEYYVNLIIRERVRASTLVLPNNAYAYRPLNNEDVEYGTFDYIVVGAGAAGAILASRLSENPTKSVLLIEAGIQETDFTDIPAMGNSSPRLGYTWNHTITPPSELCSVIPPQCFYNMGKGTGGSTIVNGLVYSRGNARDYDNWYNQGNPGWTFKDVLPFFKKSANSKINGDYGYHGFGGNVNVEYARTDNTNNILTSMFLDANRELRRHIGDYNGNNPLTVGKVQLNTIGGRRGSTGRAFLRPICNRKNLKILTESYATHILIREKRAYGIRFARQKQFYTAISKKDIIISAGAIGSPQLLMQSGIGPKSDLQKLGIPVIQNLGVGTFFKNHFSTQAVFVTNHTEPRKNLEGVVRDYLNSEGQLTNPSQVLAVGFFQTNVSKISRHPDIEVLLSTPVSGEFQLSLIMLHPESEGYIRLKSNDPFDYPIINPNPLSETFDKDTETLYQGIRLIMDFLNTKAFRRVNASLKYIDIPPCNNHEYLSKAYWYCRIKLLTAKSVHPIGTCKMGPDPTTGAVVDHKLKVHGITNLRVADASIMPDTISGHNSAPSMMIGEKAAHIITNG